MAVVNKLDTFHGNNAVNSMMPTVSVEIGIIDTVDTLNMEATITYPKKGSIMEKVPIAGLFQFSDKGNLQPPAIGTPVIILSAPPIRPFVLCSIVGRNSAMPIKSDILTDEQLFTTASGGIIKQTKTGDIEISSRDKNYHIVSGNAIYSMAKNLVQETAFTQHYTATVGSKNIDYQKIAHTAPVLSYFKYDELINEETARLNEKKIDATFVEYDNFYNKLKTSMLYANFFHNACKMFDVRNQNQFADANETINNMFDIFLFDSPTEYTVIQTGAVTNKKISSISDLHRLADDDFEKDIVHQISIIKTNVDIETGEVEDKITVAMQVFSDGSVKIPNLI